MIRSPQNIPHTRCRERDRAPSFHRPVHPQSGALRQRGVHPLSLRCGHRERRADQTELRLAAGARAICLAACIGPLSLRRDPYGANRAHETARVDGKEVFKGGENNIVVYSINQSTGEPTPIQHIETRGIHPRTFHIDPSGRMMVLQHNRPAQLRDGSAIRTVAAGLSVLRIGDGRQADVCPQVRYRRRRRTHVLDGHGAAVGGPRRADIVRAVTRWGNARPP